MSSSNTPLYIAQRYFVSHRRKNKNSYRSAAEAVIGQSFIKILTNISMVGLGVGTAALIIILSVFNGLEELTMSLYNTYNPELKVTPIKGKTFEVTESLVQQIERIPYVKAVTEVIEDGALLRYDGKDMLVTVKGVSDNFLQQYDLEKTIVGGKAVLKEDGRNRALIGIGIQHQLSIPLEDKTKGLLLYYPERGKISVNPDDAFNRSSILPSGVFAIEQQFDLSYVFVPIEFAKELLQYEDERTSLEISAVDQANLSEVQAELKALFGEDFEVKNAEEQQETVLRAVKIERLFVFITFVFILAIASFNVFFSLAMLAIEKKKDIAIMISMGAAKGIIKKIFLYEGAIVAFTGAVLGLILGFVIVFIQQEFGLVSLGVRSSIVDAYPVKLKAMDFVYTGLVVVAIKLLASYIPARNASRTVVQEQV